MAAATPTSTLDLLDLLQKSRIWPDAELQSRLDALGPVPEEPTLAASFLIRHNLLTPFQARILLSGKHRGFRLGAYVIRDQIGQGGMGAVYLGHHEGLRRPVAIKVLTPPDKSAVTKVSVERFLREARSAAALDHPNIVRIFDVAQLGAMHYLVMEYVEGQTLEQMVTVGGPVACGRAVEYVLQAAAGLEHAYLKGFVHRDIKPANLILGTDGTLKILDMGLARSEDAGDQVTEVFDKGAVVGTADYVSPEQAMNAPDLDIRADIYSLGATFYMLVTGKPPFSGSTTQKLMQHQIKETPALDVMDKTFPPGLAKVVAKMMRKRPADRYQTPGEVMAALGPWLSNTSQVVAALSRSGAGSGVGSSANLQQTLNDVVSGGTKRLDQILATADREGRRSQRPYVIGGVVAAVMLLTTFGGLAAYALSGSSAKSQAFAGQQPQTPPQPQPSPAAVTTAASATARRPTPTPAAAAEGRAIYSFEAAALADFRETWRSEPGLNGSQFPEQVVKSSNGDGKLPEGWARMNYRVGTTSEVAVATVRGAKGFGLTTAGGEHTTMVFTPSFSPAGQQLRLKIEYLLEGSDGSGQVLFARIAPAPQTDGRPVGELTATDGKWVTREFGFDAQGASEGRLEFHNYALPTGKMLWVRSLRVTEAVVEAAPTARGVAGPPAFDFAADSLADFREQFRSVPSKAKPGTRESVVLGRSGEGKLPAGWWRENYRDDTVGELAVETTDGDKAIGITRLEGLASSMLITPPFGPTDAAFAVTIAYKTDGADGASVVRLLSDAPIYDLLKLPATEGRWVTREVVVRPKSLTKCRLEIHTDSLPIGKTLWIKSIRTSAANPASAQVPAPPPAERAGAGKVLFRADFGELGLFREKARSADGPDKSKVAKVLERSGDGQLPAGWQLLSWHPDTVHEVSVAELYGVQALTIRTVRGNPTTMLFTPRVEFPGQRVRVRIEYALPGGAGRCLVRHRQLAPEFGDVWDVAWLERTGGAWQVAEFDLERREATAGHLEFHTTELPEGQAVALKSVTVFQPAE